MTPDLKLVSKTLIPSTQSINRVNQPDVMALAKQGIERYREALIELSCAR
jgi:hypothetical protein